MCYCFCFGAVRSGVILFRCTTFADNGHANSCSGWMDSSPASPKMKCTPLFFAKNERLVSSAFQIALFLLRVSRSLLNLMFKILVLNKALFVCGNSASEWATADAICRWDSFVYVNVDIDCFALECSTFLTFKCRCFRQTNLHELGPSCVPTVWQHSN